VPSLGLVDKRIFGLSDSYSVFVSAAGQRQLSPEDAGRRLFGPVASGGLAAGVVLRNGGRLHLGAASRPEYATPECGSVPDLVVHDKAGERILEGMLAEAGQRLREEGDAGDISVFKISADPAGSSYGCQEDYLVARRGEFGRLADVLIPFCSVDPHDGASAVGRLRDLVASGARGLKLHPSLQAFAPNERSVYPLYEAAADVGVPIVFHTGQTGIGAGLPGGRGIKLRYSDPMLIDDVAADFPTLSIVLAHPSVPWQDAAISIATHKANVMIDLSGWSPKYFPPQLVQAANGRLKHKVMFGSDYPLITPDRWLGEFDALDIKADVRQLILKDNAARLLGL